MSGAGMTLPAPLSIEEVTPAWMTQALQDRGRRTTGCAVAPRFAAAALDHYTFELV